MKLRLVHELHKRRFGRNIGVGLLLLALVAIMFGLTVVKVTNSDFKISTETQS